MNRFRNILSITLFASALAFGACSQDETMDDLISNTEISSPASFDATTGDSSKDEDKPS